MKPWPVSSALRLLRPSDALPSIETLMHAFIDKAVVVHTHPTAILTLTNRAGGEETVVAALGDDVGVLPYVNSGLALGQAVADACEQGKELRAIVILHHGLITWGETPKEAYDRTIEMVGRAEAYLKASRRSLLSPNTATSLEERAEALYENRTFAPGPALTGVRRSGPPP